MKKYRLADIAEIVISSVDKKTKPGEKIVRLCNFTDVYHNWAIKQSDYDSFMVASASDSNINKLSLKKGFVASCLPLVRSVRGLALPNLCLQAK